MAAVVLWAVAPHFLLHLPVQCIAYSSYFQSVRLVNNSIVVCVYEVVVCAPVSKQAMAIVYYSCNISATSEQTSRHTYYKSNLLEYHNAVHSFKY
jgi:hypothetical protein